MSDPIQTIAKQLGIQTFGDGLLVKIRETIDLLRDEAYDCKQYREVVTQQAREIAVLKANVITDNSMVLVNALAELERLKAQSGAVVPDSVVWIDAHHIQPGNNPSFIRDVALVSAVKTTETQVPLVRLNSSPVSAGDERATLSAFTAWGESIGLSPALQTVGELKAFKAGAEWKVRAALSAPSHGEQVREALEGALTSGRGTSGRIILDARDEAELRAVLSTANGEVTK